MKPIDRFIAALFRQNADELLLESGKQGRIRVGTEERVILAQEVRTEQIDLLLADILPPDVQKTYRADGEIAFPYKSSAGPVIIRARRSGGQVVAVIRPYTVSSNQAAERMAVKSAPQAPGAAVAARAMAPRPTAPVAARPHPTPNENDSQPLELDMQHTGEMPALTDPLLVAAQNAAPQGPVIVASGAGIPRAPTDPMAGLPAQAPMSSGYLGSSPSPVAQAQVVAAPVASAPMASAPVAFAPMASAPSAPMVSAPVAAPSAPAMPVSEPFQGGEVNGIKIKNRIDPILISLVQAGGSDLHITSGLAPRMRKDGDICGVPGHTDVLGSQTIEQWLMEIAPEKSRVKFRESSDADYGYEVHGVARIRVNAFRDRRGVGGVMRVIPSKILTAQQLGLPKCVLELCDLPKGLVVVTGPTGSGKSTTLAGMIDHINRTRSDHVITIEDPVEFVHQPMKCLINQREVHQDTLSFNAGLRAALREDPDIVLVGEMRDLETIALGVETAETGHLVFGTLHTTTAISTIDRIIDQFPSDRQQQIRVMLSSALKGVVAQTLCKKIGGGRCAAIEILLVLPSVSNLIREGKNFQIASVMQTNRALGMQTLNDALFELVRDGKVDQEEALGNAVAKGELKQMIDRLSDPNATPPAKQPAPNAPRTPMAGAGQAGQPSARK